MLGLFEFELPQPAFDGVAFAVLHNEHGFAEVELTAMLAGDEAGVQVAFPAWLVSPQEVGDMSVGLGADGVAVWQNSDIEGRVVWRGLLTAAPSVRVYMINRLVGVERPVYLCALLPDGRVEQMDTLTITRYVAPPPG